MGVFRLTINDEDDPDRPENWTVEEAEWLDALPPDAPFLVCRLLTFPLFDHDNHLGRCTSCNRPIQFRPDTAPEVVKICDLCAPEWMVAHAKAS